VNIGQRPQGTLDAWCRWSPNICAHLSLPDTLMPSGHEASVMMDRLQNSRRKMFASWQSPQALAHLSFRPFSVIPYENASSGRKDNLPCNWRKKQQDCGFPDVCPPHTPNPPHSLLEVDPGTTAAGRAPGFRRDGTACFFAPCEDRNSRARPRRLSTHCCTASNERHPDGAAVWWAGRTQCARWRGPPLHASGMQ